MSLFSMHDFLVFSVASVGLLSVSKTLCSALKFIWCGFIRPPKRLSSYGPWAVVTGCTDGIGKALAFDLAKAGLNLVLVGRNTSKLEALTSELLQKCGGNNVETRSVLIDFAEMNVEEIRRRIKEGIEGLDVGLLVNNAGLAYPYPRFFHEVDSKLLEDVLRVNIDAATWVTEAVLPGMVERGKGAIVNVGSGSSCCVPCYPLFSIYAASKAYLEMFSQCLGLEYKKQGIDVQCQANFSHRLTHPDLPFKIPLFVATKMSNLRRLSGFIASPEEYSQKSLRWIGYDRLCVPFWPHYLQVQLLKLFPGSVVSQYLFRYFLTVREKGIKKDARAKAKANALVS